MEEADPITQLDKHKMYCVPPMILTYFFDILNILLSIKFYYCGEISYAITIWVLFSLDKLIIIFSSLSNRSTMKTIFTLLDLLNLGWIYIIFADRIYQSSLYCLCFRSIVSRGIIQNIIQFIFFFYIKLLENEKIGYFYIQLAYCLYLAQVIFYFCQISYLSIQIKSQITFKLIQNLIALFTCHMTYASLSYLEDQHGNRLIYYNFIIIAAQYIFVLYYFQKYQTGYNPLAVFINVLHNIIIFKETKYRDKYMLISNFLGSFIRFVLFMIFGGIKTLREIQTNDNLNQKIFSVNNLIVTLCNSVYFVLFLYLIIKNSITLKVIILKNNQSFETVNEQLSKIDLELTKDIEIVLNDGLHCVQINQQQDDICQNKSCAEYYEMYKNIQKIHDKRDISLNFTSNFYIQCNYHLEELFTKQAEIHHTLIFNIRFYSKNLNLAKLLMKRIFKGFLFNTANTQLIAHLTDDEQTLLRRIQAFVLSLKALDICFKDYSLNYLPQIMYDLHDA